MLKRSAHRGGVSAQNETSTTNSKRDSTLPNPLRTLFLGKSKSRSSVPSSTSPGELHITTPPKLQQDLAAYDTARRQERESTSPSHRLTDHFYTPQSAPSLSLPRGTSRPVSVELTSQTPPRLVVKAHSPTQHRTAQTISFDRALASSRSVELLKSLPKTPVQDSSPNIPSGKYLDSPIDPVMSARVQHESYKRMSQFMSRFVHVFPLGRNVN